MHEAWTALGLALIIAIVGARWLVRHVYTLRARTLTPLALRYLAPLMKRRDLTDEEFYRADGAGPAEVARRQAGLERLARIFRERYPESLAWAESIRDSFSYLRFTDANRVPFPFARFMRERLSPELDQPALPHHQLQRVPGLLRVRLLGPHDGDVGRHGRTVSPAIRSRHPGAALPRQGGNAPRLQHTEQVANPRELPDIAVRPRRLR
jgi:hypothetical protein